MDWGMEMRRLSELYRAMSDEELLKLDATQLKRMGETMLAELEDYRRRSRARH